MKLRINESNYNHKKYNLLTNDEYNYWYNVGMNAFYNGERCVPAYNKEIVDYMTKNPAKIGSDESKKSNQIAKVWSDGWNFGNLNSNEYKFESLKETETPNIEVKHEGILEVPEGKNVDDLPLSHFVNLANKKGLSKITKALNNLQVWNKNDDPKLSKWAGDMIDKLNKKLKKDESLKKLNETNAIVIDIPKQEYDFHFKGTDKDGWKRDVHKVIVKYNNKGYFVDLILIDDNGVKVNSVRKKFKFVGKDIVITDADRNDIVIGHIVDNTNEGLTIKEHNRKLKKIERYEDYPVLQEFIDFLAEANIEVIDVYFGTKSIKVDNLDLEDASFYLQDRDYFGKDLYKDGWTVVADI